MPTQLCTMELSTRDEVPGSIKEQNLHLAEDSLNIEKRNLMDLDESLTNRKELIIENCKTNGHIIANSTLIESPNVLNQSACSVINISDSTPDVSYELVTSKEASAGCVVSTTSSNVPNELGNASFNEPRIVPRVRDSDIYITDIYNVNDLSIGTESVTAETPTEPAALETINEADNSQKEESDHSKNSHDSVSLFRNVHEYVGNFLEPASVETVIAPQPSAHISNSSVIADGEKSKTSNSYAQVYVNVRCTVMRKKAADGGTINELVSIQCDKNVIQTSSESTGIHGDLSSAGSSDLIQQTLLPPPPPAAGKSILSQRYRSRFSNVSSSSGTSGSSIASSASVLAARMIAIAASSAASIATTEHEEHTFTTPPLRTEFDADPPLSHERISELRDKWRNSQEVWRLLDYLDRTIDKNKHVTMDETQYLNSTWRRGRKTKQSDNEWLKPNEEKLTPKPAKRRKTTNQTSSGTSAFSVGSRVFAKWTDRRFYAATLIESKPDGRWVVEFYDGNERPVSEEHMLYVDDAALIGQKVFARGQLHSDSGGSDDFQAGIVTGCESDETNTRLIFTVARNDNDIRVPSEHILLTEHQVRQIKRNPNTNGDHRASPILSSSAYRSTRSKTRTNRVDSPVPGSSGTQRRRNRNASSNGQTTTRQRGRGRPRRQNADSSVGQRNTTSNSDETRDDADYEDYDDDDDSSTTNCTLNGNGNNVGYSNAANVFGLEPEAAASYDVSDRIKGKTVDGKATRFGREPREEETAALGPMPPAGTQPFKGMHVLLSCASEATLSAVVTRTSTNELENDCGEDGKSSCASSDYDCKFSTRPFVKARLRAQLIAGGATMLDSLEGVPPHKLGQTYLIANRPSKTAVYVACMAAGLRIYCHDWVIRCCVEGKYLPPQELPYGWSIERDRYFMSFERQGTQGSGCTALKRRFILISDGGDENFTSYWTHVLKLSGANVKNLSVCDDSEISRALCILCDCGHKDERAVLAHRRGTQLVTTIWLVQTLVHGELRKFDTASSYRPDYVDHSD